MSTFNQGKWKWYHVSLDKLAEIDHLMKKHPGCEMWINEVEHRKSNSLRVDSRVEGGEFIWGSLVYQQDVESREDYNLFHFYLTRDFFITVDLKLPLLEKSDFGEVQKQMDHADNAVEGFFILIGEILNDYLDRIDLFEDRLHGLLWKVKKQNNLKILERIYDNRHELLIWKNLMIPITELKLAAEEAFGDSISEGREFKRTARRLTRGRIVIQEYQQEIDTLIDLEEVVSSHRGNEIMKTLTVMTIMFTPVMAWGALWGMNFKLMPELGWKFGYVLAIGLIVLSTVGLYVYLKMKGWIGDILKGKKNNSFFE
ncbi:magnesium transporter CorA family protein [Mesobacillus zeae]|uniref:Mg2+ transporter protein, CorA-like protein n=1 Tax=Mesobacillus zeae TaxID=1917180 RepID=A0A398B5K5_9BACI|nr:magnesium transporter CorA family protein [Mesobacillus zeae]RID85205.1 Mg2+ transporter protein, CorA-like protein [Mesobacillus zeae]